MSHPLCPMRFTIYVMVKERGHQEPDSATLQSLLQSARLNPSHLEDDFAARSSSWTVISYPVDTGGSLH